MDPQILHQRADGHVTVVLRGDFPSGSVGALRSALTEAISTAGTGVVIDLGDVGFVDAAVLGVLVGEVARGRDLPGGLSLTRIPPHADGLLHLLALDCLCAQPDTPPPALVTPAWPHRRWRSRPGALRGQRRSRRDTELAPNSGFPAASLPQNLYRILDVFCTIDYI